VGHNGRCYAYLMQEKYSDALIDCSEAIRLDPKGAEFPRTFKLQGSDFYITMQKLHSALSTRVLDCYKLGNVTVREMHACAGVWGTPRILTLCVLDAGCPVFPDTINSRAVIEAALGRSRQNRHENLN